MLTHTSLHTSLHTQSHAHTLIHSHSHSPTHTHSQVHTHLYPFIHAQTYSHNHAHTHTHIPLTCSCTLTFTHSHTYTDLYIHIYSYSLTYTHSHPFTHVHTLTHNTTLVSLCTCSHSHTLTHIYSRSLTHSILGTSFSFMVWIIKFISPPCCPLSQTLNLLDLQANNHPRNGLLQAFIIDIVGCSGKAMSVDSSAQKPGEAEMPGSLQLIKEQSVSAIVASLFPAFSSLSFLSSEIHPMIFY